MEACLLISDFYNSTATVEKETQTTNQMGGIARSYSTRISSLLCRITDKDIRELDEFGKWTTRRGLRLYCDATTANLAIIPSDRIVLGSRTFQVKAIGNPGILNHHLELDLLEIL
jgi:hypothetical protein